MKAKRLKKKCHSLSRNQKNKTVHVTSVKLVVVFHLEGVGGGVGGCHPLKEG